VSSIWNNSDVLPYVSDIPKYYWIQAILSIIYCHSSAVLNNNAVRGSTKTIKSNTKLMLPLMLLINAQGLTTTTNCKQKGSNKKV
jgi:hypothetical protein